MQGEKPRWYKVQIYEGQRSLSDFLPGTHSAPAVQLGTRCACCNVETPYKMEMNPSAGNFIASNIRVPRCYECRLHMTGKQTQDAPAVIGGVAAAGCIPLAIFVSWWFAIPAALILAGTMYWIVRFIGKRRELQAQGHFTGILISMLPHFVSIRTTNPRLANDIAALNTRN